MLQLDSSTGTLPPVVSDGWTFGACSPSERSSSTLLLPESNHSLFRSFSERMRHYIERPWSPPDEFLPMRRGVEESGNSPDPFRTLAFTGRSPSDYTRSLVLTKNSEVRTKMSS